MVEDSAARTVFCMVVYLVYKKVAPMAERKVVSSAYGQAVWTVLCLDKMSAFSSAEQLAA